MYTGDQKYERVNLDTILEKEIGQFGRFQLRLAALAAILVVFMGWSGSEYLFTTARLTTRCHIPECENGVSIFLPSWISNAIPTSDGSIDNCQRFAPLNRTDSMNEECPIEIFDTDQTISCDEFVYEDAHSSAVYDFNLACDEWRRTLIGSLRTVGAFGALPLIGFISDRWGRRIAIIFCAISTGVFGLTRYITNTYIGFVVSEMAEATFGGGGFSSSYIYLMEMTGPKYRVVGGAILNTSFALGQVTTALIAWAVPNWRNLILALYIPQFLTIAYFWVLPESARWCIGKGKYDKAEKVIKLAAKVNKKELSQKSLQGLRNNTEEEKKFSELQKIQKAQEPSLIVQVFRHKPILLRAIVSPVWWISMTFVYYGLSINSINMVGNKYLNFALVSAVEIPGFWTSMFLMSRIGRKPVMIGAYWVCALCQIGYIFMPKDHYAVSLIIYLIGKYSISMVVASIYMYTNELYPTRYRHNLFAFSSMIGRIGTLTAPLTPALAVSVWEELPFVLFGGFALLSGLLVMLTPETLGTKLPDTMEEASNLACKRLTI